MTAQVQQIRQYGDGGHIDGRLVYAFRGVLCNGYSAVVVSRHRGRPCRGGAEGGGEDLAPLGTAPPRSSWPGKDVAMKP